MNEKKLKSIKQLSEEQLDRVTGGDAWGDEKSAHLPATHGRHIGMYDAEHYIGQKFYFVKDGNPGLYFWGTLTRAWDYEGGRIWTSRRTYDIEVEGVITEGIQVYCCGYRKYVEVTAGQRLPIVLANDLTIFLYEKD